MHKQNTIMMTLWITATILFGTATLIMSILYGGSRGKYQQLDKEYTDEVEKHTRELTLEKESNKALSNLLNTSNEEVKKAHEIIHNLDSNLGVANSMIKTLEEEKQKLEIEVDVANAKLEILTKENKKLLKEVSDDVTVNIKTEEVRIDDIGGKRPIDIPRRNREKRKGTKK